jgi:MSHA biogenesis protein MshQ
VNLSSAVTLNIVSNGFKAGNDVTLNSNGFSFLITATEDVDIGKNFTGQVSITASGKTINISSNAKITGNLTAGSLNIGSGSTITGACTPSNAKCTGGLVPTVSTLAATSISATGATLNGRVSSNGSSTTVTFEYGLTTAYGSTTTASQSPLISSASNTAVSAAVTALVCGQTYHFRVKGVNSVGTANGGDLSFATSACLPIGPFFPVPIPTDLLNQNITTWSGGGTYTSYMSGRQTLGGVPFEMQTNAATGMDVVWGTGISVFDVPGGVAYTHTATLNTNLYGASTVYTLINSAWGATGNPVVGSITFKASNGDSYTVNLVEGVNVRDHYQGGFVNSVSASYVTTNVVGVAGSGAHLDMQAFALPASFANEILSSVVFTSTGSSATGLPFLAGVTVNASRYGIDHVRLDHTGSGLTCMASSVTVTACETPDSGGSCTPSTLGISGTISAPMASGTLTKAFTIPAGSSSSTVLMADATAETVTFSAGSYSIIPSSSSSKYSCWNSTSGSASCSHIFSGAGFVFSDTAGGVGATIPAQVAGIEATGLYLRAVQASTTNPAHCTPAIVSSVASVTMGYACNNPTTCQAGNLATITNSTTSTATAIAPGGTSVSLNFDANGSAPITARYDDVGQITLTANASFTPFGSATAVPLNGSSSFVVAPHHLVISGVTTGPIKAGGNFSATVTAYNGLATATVTPNFGKESPAESVNFLLGARVAPLGANDCVNGPCSGAVTGSVSLPWVSGAATASNLTYSEVGQMTLAATLASGSYLGSGKTATGVSATVGDFVPAYFDTAVTPGCASFTYSGQPFALVSVTAKNTSGATTLNYSNLGGCAACSKSVTLSDAGGAINFNGTNTLAATAFAKGVGTSSSVTYTFPSKTSAPATITLRAVDATVTPNVTSNVSTATYPSHVEAAASMRSGRIRLLNAYGSELLDLPVTMHAQYWDGNAWVLNVADTCTGDTTLNANNAVTIVLTPVTLDPTKTCVWDSAAPGLSGSGCAAAGVPNKKYKEGATPSVGFTGDFNLWLKAPGSGNSGAVNVSATVPSWLRYNWTGAVVNPSARATFGIYKSPLIYRRENY